MKRFTILNRSQLLAGAYGDAGPLSNRTELAPPAVARSAADSDGAKFPIRTYDNLGASVTHEVEWTK
jgi:hypothetical protein